MLQVALHVYKIVKDGFEKVLYVNPSMLSVTDPNRRLELASDQILDLCHYRREKKLLIVDEVWLFGGGDSQRRELLRMLANVCTKHGQILSGHQSRGDGCLKVILCLTPAWKLELERIGVCCDGVDVGGATEPRDPPGDDLESRGSSVFGH